MKNGGRVSNECQFDRSSVFSFLSPASIDRTIFIIHSIFLKLPYLYLNKEGKSEVLFYITQARFSDRPKKVLIGSATPMMSSHPGNMLEPPKCVFLVSHFPPSLLSFSPLLLHVWLLNVIDPETIVTAWQSTQGKVSGSERNGVAWRDCGTARREWERYLIWWFGVFNHS